MTLWAGKRGRRCRQEISLADISRGVPEMANQLYLSVVPPGNG